MAETSDTTEEDGRERKRANPSQAPASNDVTPTKAPTERNAIYDNPKLSPEEMDRALQLSILAASKHRVDESEDKKRKYADANSKAKGEGLPEEWRDRLLPDKDKYVMREEPTIAVFAANSKALTTRLNDPSIAKLLAATADERGWSSVKVTGTDLFRREAWVEATARGIAVTGYQAREVDHHEVSLRAKSFEGRNQIQANEKAIRNLAPGDMARRNEEHRNAAAAIGASSKHIEGNVTNPSDKRVMEQALRNHMASSNGQSAREVKMRDPEGRIVSMGFQPYKFDETQTRSFYVRLEKNGVERDIWGVGLSEAMANAKAVNGDYVKIKQVGSKPVTIDAQIRDSQGRVTGTEKKNTQRNAFAVTVKTPAQEQIRQAAQQHNMTQQPQQKTQDQTRGRSR